MTTRDLILELKEAGQDFEFYPTTDRMIEIVSRRIPEDAGAIMDIGAGDGRVLAKLSQKCKHATLYGMEISPILRQSQPENIVPIGTNIFEQNLSCLNVDYIFCNPRYSEFEDWVCKIVAEGFAKKAFLIIPQRWVNSKTIETALKLRNATARVIHSDDFYDGDRQARAIIDIVEISFPLEDWGRNVLDPFNIWFDQNISTFDKAEEFKESETGSDLARRFSTASIDEMVAAYLAEYHLLENNYRAIFKLDYAILNELGVNKEHVRDGLKKKMSGLKSKYWHVLFERLDAITSRLSTKSKEKLLSKLTSNASVEFTSGNAYSVVIWAIKNANQYFDEQLIDLFYELSTFEGVFNYKSNVRAWQKDRWRYVDGKGREQLNTHYALDYRIVVSRWNGMNKDGYDRWNYPGGLHRDCHNTIADVIAVFGNLGFQTNSQSSLDRQWSAGKWQDFYQTNTEKVLFQVKAHLNGNLHFRFMPEAIKALNINAGRLLKWVRDENDVVTELGYSMEDAAKYFNANAHILPNNIKLLGS